MRFKMPDEPIQVRYQLYIDAHNLKEGDAVEPFGFRKWIGKHSSIFKKKHNLKYWSEVVAAGLQDDFTEYLEKCAEYESQIAKGQADIFDYLGG